MIHTENLSKKFGQKLAVDNLNLDISQGEVFGFLGPNGAGKTTTIRMLSGLIGPTCGNASVAGFKVGGQEMKIRQNVGVLTETPGMYENLSAETNLKIFANLYEVKDIPRQVEKYLRKLGIWEYRNEPVATFSKGMKQKLAIARALLHEPRLLFLDEPTSGLDPEASQMIRKFITELKSEGRTIFLCTHNLDEADRLCDRIGIFKSRLLIVDSPAALRKSVFGYKLVIHLRSVNEDQVAALQQLDFVEAVNVVEDKLVVQVEDPLSHNPDLIRTLVAANADILFVGELRYSLEDVYLKLLKNN